MSKSTSLINYFKSQHNETARDFVQLYVNDQLAKTGNYIIALSSSLEILDRFKQREYTPGILTAYRILSTTYYYAGDTKLDVEYGKKAAALASLMDNNSALASIYNNLSTSYAQKKMADSAIAYALQAVVYAEKTKDTTVTMSVYGTLGEAYILQKDYDKALLYIRQSLKNPDQSDALGIAWSLNDLAKIFLETNMQDSAKFYAHKALRISATNHFKDQIQRSYEYLSQSYTKTNAADSALKYLQLAVVIKDSLYTSEKTKQVQGITDREQTRLQEMEQAKMELNNKVRMYGLLAGLAVLALVAFLLLKNNRQKHKANTALETMLSTLQETQSQLVQSEKMASLGELTAGIAHEIQNPLNFINNFSELNTELIDEMQEEIDKGSYDTIRALTDDIKENSQKINYHGKRADGIVKGMLQHSRSSTGVKELTDINALCDEYLRLSYHGLRAKDKSFNAKFMADFDPSLPKVSIVPQDIGRVVLNLINNAFYAVAEKKKSGIENYEPTVTVKTEQDAAGIKIIVSDNGKGIPENIVSKIFQPFFTTKPSGEGTGLGLSLSYDIVTRGHGGQLAVKTKTQPAGEEQGTQFSIFLPNKTLL